MPNSAPHRATHGAYIVAADGSTVVFDVTTSETHTDRWRITNHPVSSGASVSDHVQREPTQLELEGVVSNTPLYLADPEPDRANGAYDLLRQVAERKEIVDVITRVRLYANMVVAELSRQRGTDVSADEAKINIRLQQVIRAESRTVAVDPEIFAAEVRPRAAEDEDAETVTVETIDYFKDDRAVQLTIAGDIGATIGGESIPETEEQIYRLMSESANERLPLSALP